MSFKVIDKSIIGADEMVLNMGPQHPSTHGVLRLKIITDGEIRRENYIHYHCRHINGIDFNNLTKKVARTGNYECMLPTITNKVEPKETFFQFFKFFTFADKCHGTISL